MSFLFNLLVKAVKRLLQSKNESHPDLSATDEDQLCNLLEQVVDKWLIEEAFLNTGWLTNMRQLGEQSVKQKKRSKRKSRESLQLETSIEYQCSNQIGELLRVAIESCSRFKMSPVVRLAVARVLGGSKSLLVGAQHDGTLGVCVCVCVCAFAFAMEYTCSVSACCS